MGFLDDTDHPTAEAMADPQPGDCFGEMYSFYVWVVEIDTDRVVTCETPGVPCTLPDDGIWRVQSRAVFRGRFAYGHGAPGYWVRLYKREPEAVKGWMDVYYAKLKAGTHGHE